MMYSISAQHPANKSIANDANDCDGYEFVNPAGSPVLLFALFTAIKSPFNLLLLIDSLSDFVDEFGVVRQKVNIVCQRIDLPLDFLSTGFKPVIVRQLILNPAD
jgi:hypothetical protein